MNRPTIDAIELAWFGTETALQVSQRFKGVTRYMVNHVWATAHAAGRLPKCRRDQLPAEFEKLFREMVRSNAQPVHRLKVRAA